MYPAKQYTVGYYVNLLTKIMKKKRVLLQTGGTSSHYGEII